MDPNCVSYSDWGTCDECDSDVTYRKWESDVGYVCKEKEASCKTYSDWGTCEECNEDWVQE